MQQIMRDSMTDIFSMPDKELKVAAFQGHISEGNSGANLNKIIEISSLAEKTNIDLLTFPESYLHGYFSKKDKALKNSDPM
jgi:predicted amidohydrolase